MEQQSLQFVPLETNPALSVQTAPLEVAQNTVTPELLKLTEDLTPEEQRMVRTIPRLRNRALRREAANALKQAPPETLTPLFTALKKPFSRRWREAQVAAWTLGSAPLQPEQKQQAVEALTRLLQIPVTRKHRFRATQVVTVAAALFPLILSVLLTLKEWQNYHMSLHNIVASGFVSVFLFTFFLLPLLAPFSLLIDAVLNKRKNRVRATAATPLGRLAAPESVDILSETLKDKTPVVQNAALRAFVPLLTSAHYGHFGPHITTALCRALQDKDDAWVLDCLDAIEKVEGSGAIFAVERLLQLRGWKLREEETSDRVSERATQVLAILKQRTTRENVSRHLLRASVEPSAASDVLLRAASGDSRADGTHLLRASINAEP